MTIRLTQRAPHIHPNSGEISLGTLGPEIDPAWMYAAFAEGVPVIGVWGFDRAKLEALVRDRAANGESLSGEAAIRITIPYYLAKLREHGYSVPLELRELCVPPL